MSLPELSGLRIDVVGTRRQLLLGAVVAASSTVVSVRHGSADEPERVSDASGRWSIERAQQWYGTQPWLSGCNYMPSTAINQLEMFQADSFDPAVIDREFGLAEGLGFNSVRVFLHDLLWQQDSAGFLGVASGVLQLAEAHGIRVMFVLFDSCWHPVPRLGRQPQPLPHTHNSGWVQSPGIEVLQKPSEWGRLREYVQGVVRHFRDDGRVVVWDIWNEPDNFDGGAAKRPGLEPRNKPELVNRLLPQVFGWVRDVGPSQPLTSGVWRDSENIRELDACKRIQLSHSDVISFHTYGDAASLNRCLTNLGHYGRPLLCTEFMARPNGSVFEPHLQMMRDGKCGAWCWGFINGKSQTIYPWDSWTKTYGGPPPEWFHDVLQPDGTPFRQSEVDYIRRVTGAAVK
ncbi:MAG UNVERIFIED_CONTAM: cellulase family glycosylhydrolase [Planctomycetaceae bacterium]